MAAGGSQQFEFRGSRISCQNVTNMHLGDIFNYNFPRPTEKDLRLKELENKLHYHLKNIHVEENRLIQFLPTDEDEELSVEEHYSPLKITLADSEQELELSDVIDDHTKIHIAGDAGSGKSTLCKKMCYDWGSETENNNYLDHFKYVFNVPLRLVGDETVKNYIFNQIIDDEFDSESIQSILNTNGDKILFFLDGLDEISNCESIRAIFKSFPTATFVVSSRFAWDQKKLKDEKFKRRLVLHGFTDEAVDIFRSRYFADLPDNRSYIDKLIKSDDSCGKICVKNFKCPLFLRLLFYCLKFSTSERRQPLKVTQLYVEMFDILRAKFDNGRKSISELDLSEKLRDFGEMALRAIKDDTILFDKIDIADESIIKLGFLRQETFTGRDNKKMQKFQPVHKTFLEFLAALHFKHLLLNDIDKFYAEIDSLPDKSIHSKHARSGAKFSLLIVFLCGLLGKDAHLFFRVLDFRFGDRFKNVLNIILLLWHSDVTAENIEHVARSRRLNQNCLTDFAERSNDINVNKSNWLILAELIKHPKCTLGKLNLNESTLIKIDTDSRKLIVESLSINRSITRLELIRIGTTPLSADVSDDVLAEKMPCFIDIVKSISSIGEIVVNQDIFVDKISIHDRFFQVLIAALTRKSKLEKLSIIGSPILFDVCDIFIDYVSPANGVTDSKAERKRAKPKLTQAHIDSIIDYVSPGIRELHLMRLSIDNIDTFPFIDLQVLKLPFLECKCELHFLFRLLSRSDCKLADLDLSGYKFKSGESTKLIDTLKSNKSLICLNLAHSAIDQARLIDLFDLLKSNGSLIRLNVAHTEFTQDALLPLVDSIGQNGVIERLNLSSTNTVVDEETTKLFLNAIKSSNVKEVHLSGWKFDVRRMRVFRDVVAQMREFDKLEAFCVKNARIVFHVNFDYDFGEIRDLTAAFFDNLTFSKNFAFLNAKNFTFECVVRPQMALSDSGYFSPETETSSNPFLRQIESCNNRNGYKIGESKQTKGKLSDLMSKLNVNKLMAH